MNDYAELEQLVRLGHVCISIHTFEEDYALGVLRELSLQMNRPLWLWSVSGGVQDGLLSSACRFPRRRRRSPD